MKRYIYKSGLDIIAPLKCGTRWLDGFDVENRIDTYSIGIEDLKENIHSGTTFIWRGVREHFLSAIETDYYVEPDRTDIWESILHYQKYGGHWYPYLYKKLYHIWKKTHFRFWKLRGLSELNDIASIMPYNFKQYHFIVPEGYSSAEQSINSLSFKHLNRLEKLISEEEKWLKLMVEPQYSEKGWEEYSDLEDSNFQMKCKVKDMEAEVKLINETLVNQLELQRINNSELTNGLYTKIQELKQQNKKLQSKLDYTESVIGKLPKKLI
jgi:hypothetical protein